MTRNSREPNLYTLILHTEAGGESIPWGLSSCAPPPRFVLRINGSCDTPTSFRDLEKWTCPSQSRGWGEAAGKKSGGNGGRKETTKLSAAKRGAHPASYLPPPRCEPSGRTDKLQRST